MPWLPTWNDTVFYSSKTVTASLWTEDNPLKKQTEHYI